MAKGRTVLCRLFGGEIFPALKRLSVAHCPFKLGDAGLAALFGAEVIDFFAALRAVGTRGPLGMIRIFSGFDNASLKLDD